MDLTQVDQMTDDILKQIADGKLPQYGNAKHVLSHSVKDSQPTGDSEFKSFTDFLQFTKSWATDRSGGNAERMNRYDKSLVTKTPPTGLGETVGADGGVLVPPEFSNQLLMRAYRNDLMERVTLLPMGGNELRIPAIDETSRADGSRFGGVQGYWRAEASSVTQTKPGFKEVVIHPQSLEVVVRVTDELIADSNRALESFLGAVVESEIQFKTGDAIVNGDGVGKPLGITNANAVVTVAKEGSQAADTLQTENILKMWARLHATCRPNAIWIYDQSIEPELFTMTVGSSSPFPIFLPQGGLSGQMFNTIMGRPAIPVEFCKQLGDLNDIILFDPTSYLVGTRGGMQTAVSMHVYFLTSEQAFKFSLRMDGKPWWTSALTPFSGGDTQSCIVNLAERA